ncbi:hypothetical protein CD932_09590 [Janthinobacterium sp. PC23-8]|nr:hypothetical protein CD932_09590 [Janthinobacterium sp. PC23-8]
MMVMEEAAHRVKIGYSNNPVRRCKELYNSSSSHPYHILHVWEVADMHSVEKLIHKELAYYRPNPRREFFEVFEAYDNEIDISWPDVINGLNIHNKLSCDIDEILQKNGIKYERWYLDRLEEYDYQMRVFKSSTLS